jgi:hypothetical protein
MFLYCYVACLVRKHDRVTFKPPSGVVHPLEVLMVSIAVGLLFASAGRTQDLRNCCVLFLTADGKMEGNLLSSV